MGGVLGGRREAFPKHMMPTLVTWSHLSDSRWFTQHAVWQPSLLSFQLEGQSSGLMGTLQAGKPVGVSSEEVPAAVWCHSGQWVLLQDHVAWFSLGWLCSHDIPDGVGSTGIQDTYIQAWILLVISCVASDKSP